MPLGGVMNKNLLLIFCLIVTIIFSGLSSSFSAQSQRSPITKADNKEKRELTIGSILFILKGIKGYKQITPDTLYEIVQKLIEVKNGGLSSENFYKQVSALEMPQGKEPRYVLMMIKKDIGKHLGTDGLQKVLGEQYSDGGSFVEKTVLSHRKDVVLDEAHDAIKKVAETNPKFSVFYSEVGSWSSENPNQLKFAGDIDFNFLSGDMSTALALKKAFDDNIYKRYGRTPEELDIPCTVHGSATGEVYVGLHGQRFVEGEMKGHKVQKISFGDEGKPIGIVKGDGIDFDEAKNIMLLEAELSSSPLIDVDEMKWHKQPGIIMEMIRHFEHDIVKPNAYSDLESFVKASKYLERHFKSLSEEAGEGAVKNKKLRDFSKNLVEHKNSPRKQVELINNYFDDIGQPLPFEVDFALNKGGKSKVTIKANDKVIGKYWDQCRKTMWNTANKQIKNLITDFKNKTKTLGKDDVAGANALKNEIYEFQKMLELEDNIWRNKEHGVSEQLDKKYGDLIEDFRATVKKAKQKMVENGLLKRTDPVIQGVFNLSDGLAESKNEVSKRMAAAAWLSASLRNTPGNLQAVAGAAFAGIGKVNDTLDFIDDGLMNTIRHGETRDYATLLKNGQELYWSAQANKFLEGTGWEMSSDQSKKLNDSQDLLKKRANARIQKASDWMNKGLKKICTKRQIKLLKDVKGIPQTVQGYSQKVNNSFNQSVSASRTGQTMMKGLMVYNLSQELPVYWNAMLDDDWSKLGTELFKRRVPLGGAAEKFYMGDIYGGGWDVITTVIPPAALLSVADSLAIALAEKHWETAWSTQLESIIDELYANAEFEIVAVETTGDNIKISQWELKTLTKNSEKFDYYELLQLKKDAVREMERCLGTHKTTNKNGRTVKKNLTNRKRLECMPHEKMYDDFFDAKTDSVLMENLGKADPWIQLINEMASHKHVGDKIKDLYFDQKETRFEQLKVDFLVRIKEKLEDRRAGEQALLSGNLPKMYEELLLIAGKLSIRPQVEQKLDELFGGEATQFITSFKGSLVGAIFRGDSDVWDVYEERSAVITKSLRTYKQIWDGRKKIEQGLIYQREDQGLRILTGPYFFTGDANEDEPSSKKWQEYPAFAKGKMVETLVDIKLVAEADPVHLDLKDGSYDKGVLDRLIFHETFKEMWKHVYNHPQAKNEDSWLVAATRQYMDLTSNSPNTSETDDAINLIAGKPGQSDQDKALERFKFHEQNVEEILNEFRKHYGLKEEDELTDLRALHDRAVQLASEICTDSATATTDMISIEEKFETVDGDLTKLEDEVNSAMKTVDNLQSIASDVETAHGTAESLATMIADRSSAAEVKGSLVCQVAASMRQSKTNRERDQYYEQALSGYTDVKATFEGARVEYRDLEKSGNKIKESREELVNVQKMVQEIVTIPADLVTINSKAVSIMAKTESLLKGADDKLIELESVANSAQALEKDLKLALNPQSTPSDETPSGGINSLFKALKEAGREKTVGEVELKSILKDISNQVKTAKGCLQEARKKQSQVKIKTDKFGQRFVVLEKKMNKLQQAFLPDENGQLTEPLKTALEKATLLDLLESMAKGYLDRCMGHLLKSKLCMNDVEKMSTVAFSTDMPDVVGQTCKQAIAAVANFQYQVVSAGQATHPDWEYRVESTDPPRGAEVSLADSFILISCYDDLDIAAYLATINCDSVENSTAVYNEATRQAVCDCTNGLIWGQSRQRCVDCNQYRSIVRNAFDAGDFEAARVLTAEAIGCDWSDSAFSQIFEAAQQQACEEIAASLKGALVANNAQAASGFLGQAKKYNCNLDPTLVQYAHNLISQHNELMALQAQVDKQQREEKAQQQQQNWLEVGNAVLSGIKAIQDKRKKPPRGGGTRPSGGSAYSGGASGASAGGSSSGAKCVGHNNISCGGEKVNGRAAIDKNRDGVCDICGRSRMSNGRYIGATVTNANCQEGSSNAKTNPNEINLLEEISPEAKSADPIRIRNNRPSPYFK